MRTIAIINQKGGCAKTTTAVNLAACLAEGGARVLAVDMDPQAHATRALGVDPEAGSIGLYEVLAEPAGGCLLHRAVVPVSDRLDLAPSSRALGAIEPKLAGLGELRRTERLRLALAHVTARYDYAIVDTPPDLGLLTFCALRSAKRVIVPVETSSLSIDDACWLLGAVDLLCERLDHQIEIRILPTRFDGRTRFARAMLARVRERFQDACFDAVIRTNVKLQEAAERGVPVLQLARRANGSVDHLALALEVTEWSDASAMDAEARGIPDTPHGDAVSKRPELPAAHSTSMT